VKPYDYLIWDFNGTLLDDAPLCVHIENLLREGYGMPPISLAFFRENMCFPIKDYYLKIGMTFEDESYADMCKRFMAIYQPASLNAPFRTGVIDFIKARQSKNQKQILLSASEKNNLLEQTDYFGITGLFEEVLGIDDILGESKISLALSWLKQKQPKPDRMLLIGDTLHDFEVSQALACDCVLLTDGHNSRQRLHAAGVPVLEDMEQLGQYVGGASQRAH
jgi:phosphoglycolate phosphatase